MNIEEVRLPPRLDREPGGTINSRNAKKIRNGIIWTEYVLLNPLLAEHRPSTLTKLGDRAYLRAMKAHGHTMEFHEFDL